MVQNRSIYITFKFNILWFSMDEAERATDFSYRTIMGQKAKVTLKGRYRNTTYSVNPVLGSVFFPKHLNRVLTLLDLLSRN